MEHCLSRARRRLDAFLAENKCQRLMLYIPYNDLELTEFLGSCFHRQFMAILKAHRFRETALFTERRSRSRIFLFLSCGSKDFDISAARALRRAGVFYTESTQSQNTAPMCYAFESNTLLEQENFYCLEQLGKSDFIAPPGADWLFTYLAIRDGLYDYDTETPVGESIKHRCYNHAWCGGLHSVYATKMPKWPILFPPPWDKQHSKVFDLYPYRVMNVPSLELISDGELERSLPEPGLAVPRSSLFARPITAGFNLGKFNLPSASSTPGYSTPSSTRSHPRDRASVGKGAGDVTSEELGRSVSNLAIRDVPGPERVQTGLSNKAFSIPSRQVLEHKKSLAASTPSIKDEERSSSDSDDQELISLAQQGLPRRVHDSSSGTEGQKDGQESREAPPRKMNEKRKAKKREYHRRQRQKKAAATSLGDP